MGKQSKGVDTGQRVEKALREHCGITGQSFMALYHLLYHSEIAEFSTVTLENDEWKKSIIVDSANRGNVNVTLTEQQTEAVAAQEGFTGGTMYVDSPSFNVEGETYKLNTTLDNILDEEQIKNYTQSIGINQAIPNALKSKGYPVTKENIDMVRQIIRSSPKNLKQIIDLIPQSNLKQLGTDVSASGEINKDFA